jgi:hypothetical protein
MKFVCVRYLDRVCVQEVDMHVETATGAVGYRFWEGGISVAFPSWLWVYEGFRVRPVGDFLAGDVSEELR